MPVDSGEWPSLYNTKDKLTFAVNASCNTQVYTGLARRVEEKPSIPSGQFIFAMVTDSAHILADDFPPKLYMKGSQSTLLLLLGPRESGDTQRLQDHLAKYGVKAFAIRVPEANLAKRKLELLGSLAEFRKYDQGKAKYYTIIDHDSVITSISAFQNLLAQYNSVEAHLIADESLMEPEVYTPITLTAALLDRVFERDEIWMKCLSASDSLKTGAQMISSCAAIAQGLPGPRAMFDGTSLVLREVTGNAMGLFESGRLPHAYRPYQIAGPGTLNLDLFKDLLNGLCAIHPRELMARYAFWEEDRIKWVYSHGCSIVHYPNGIGERELNMVEVTWDRNPDELPAHDAPYQRATPPAGNKVSYSLHSINTHSAMTTVQGKRVTLEWSTLVYRNEAGEDVQVDWVATP
ncbi:protein of unknown function [Taphrina deformans PYCC 5710]|uniref:Glycosyltransferase family 31 protein n=1 Tax=Taphrina deformans (strain PYCC 5710 / ATCC 11124 / CBS 356.35 / IMI 108563 / JCM 9778 / NBRC 8474) TaxID=1097556 RepID=R4XD39_TAPDE|nr:protein of unknown function [Taphrina deformans PYCC 5710]|eukprot:CCG83518.1 protein of unknown function [Taphrina deformans PYCC 5710]